MNSNFKIFLFDHDDTLVGTMRAKWAQHKYIAQRFYQKQLSDEELKAHWGKPLTVIMQLLYETNDLERALAYNTAMRAEFPKQLFDGTLDTLHALKAAGKKLGLVTATTRANLLYDFETLGIPRELFCYLQTEEDTSFHKPDPRVFEPAKQWIAQEQVEPHEVLYVGDHLNDMAAAKNAGFGFVGVSTGVISSQEFKRHESVTIAGLSDLL